MPTDLATGMDQRNDQSWRPIFLRMLRNSGTIREAAEIVGITSQKVKAAMRADPEFKALVDDAMEDVAELLEASAFKRALAGNDLMTIFLLKGMKPEKYRDNYKPAEGSQTIVNVKAYVGFSPDDWDRQDPKTIDVTPTERLSDTNKNTDLDVSTTALAVTPAS